MAKQSLNTHLNTKTITELICCICHTFFQQNFALKFLLKNLKSRESKIIFLTLLTITDNISYDFFPEYNRDYDLAQCIENTIAKRFFFCCCWKRIKVFPLCKLSSLIMKYVRSNFSLKKLYYQAHFPPKCSLFHFVINCNYALFNNCHKSRKTFL